MYLNKIKKLLFFSFLFLNFIPSNNSRIIARNVISPKIKVSGLNKYLETSGSASQNTFNLDSKNNQIKLINSQIGSEELEIYYGDDLKNLKEKNQNQIQIKKESNIKSESESKDSQEINTKNLSGIPEETYKNDKNEIEIRADSQSEKNNTLYATGNVLVIYKKNILSAEEIIYNKEKKIINAKGNVIFLINNDIFEAESINYDFENQKGNLLKVKGFINTENKLGDFDFENIDEIRNQFAKRTKKLEISFTPEIIKNWIFTTNELIIVKNKWFAQKAVFTNDLFESDQIKFKINSLQIIIEEDLLRLKSALNYLVLEENVFLPFWFGERTISTKEDSYLGIEEGINRWNIGYDKLDKDGYFIGWKSDYLSLFGSYKFQLQPQFLLQRNFKGYSNSFPEQDASIISERVKRNTTFIDYFGLESKFEGNLIGWNNTISTKVNTLDFDKLSEASRIKVEFNKEVKFLNDNWNNKFYWVYRERVWNGTQGEAEIYEGYGWKLEKNNSWEVNGIKKNEYLGLGFGRFTAEELNLKNLTTSLKGSIFYKLGQKFPIGTEESESKLIDKSFLYIPKPIKNGLYLDTEISLLSNFYRQGIHQEYIRFGAGPEYIKGDFQKFAFDYTRLRLFPFYKITSGESVFKYDQNSDTLALDLNLDQHFFGPLLVETYGRLNLDRSSPDYGKFTKSKISINWKRRTYEFGIFYQPYNESGGIQFSIFGFE